MFLAIGQILLWFLMWPVLLASALNVSNDTMFVAYIINVVWIIILAIFK